MNYFGHSVNTRADESIGFLISKHGAVGYAVWFSLLEELALRQDNLYMVFMTPQWLRGFAASLNLDSAQIKEIIEYLAKKGLISKELHSQNILFSSNFLLNHKDYLLKLYKSKENIKNIFFDKIKNRIKVLSEESLFTMTCEEIIQIQSRLILDLLQGKSGVNPDSIRSQSRFNPESIQIQSGVNPDSERYIKEKKSKVKDINSIKPKKENPEPGQSGTLETPDPEIITPEIIEDTNPPETPEPPDPPKQTFRMFSIASEEYYIASKFAQEIKKKDSGVKINIQGWANDIFYMSNGRDRSEIEKVLLWALAHPFWQSRIVSPEKLFKNYTMLKSQMENPDGNTKQGSKEFLNETIEQKAARYKAIRERKAVPAEPTRN